MVDYSPHITGQYNPSFTIPGTAREGFSIAHCAICFFSNSLKDFPVLRNIQGGWKTSLFASDLLNEFTLGINKMQIFYFDLLKVVGTRKHIPRSQI